MNEKSKFLKSIIKRNTKWCLNYESTMSIGLEKKIGVNIKPRNIVVLNFFQDNFSY